MIFGSALLKAFYTENIDWLMIALWIPMIFVLCEIRDILTQKKNEK